MLLASEPALFSFCVIVAWNHVLTKYVLQYSTGCPQTEDGVSAPPHAQHWSDGFEASEIQCPVSALLEFYTIGKCPQFPRLTALCCLEMPSNSHGICMLKTAWEQIPRSAAPSPALPECAQFRRQQMNRGRWLFSQDFSAFFVAF